MAIEYESVKSEAFDTLMAMQLEPSVGERISLAQHLFRADGPFNARSCARASRLATSQEQQIQTAIEAGRLLNGFQISAEYLPNSTQMVPSELDIAYHTLAVNMALPTFVMREHFDGEEQYLWITKPRRAKSLVLNEACQKFRSWPLDWRVDGLANFRFVDNEFKQIRESPESFYGQRIMTEVPAAVVAITEDSEGRSASLGVGIAQLIMTVTNRTRVTYLQHNKRFELRNVQLAADLPYVHVSDQLAATWTGMTSVMSAIHEGFLVNIQQHNGSFLLTP